MSIVTLFTRTAPSLGGLQFDAVLEDTFEASVEWTDYPIESGARAIDHGIIQPKKWSLIGAVSNNPIKPTAQGIAAGVASNFVGGNLIAAAGTAATIASFVAGSEDTRASEALTKLLEIMNNRESFTIDAGDIQLQDMVISKISRTKDPENENGLIFEAELQELATLDTVLRNNQPGQDQLNPGDESASQAAADTDKGEQSTSVASASQQSAIDSVLL